jgi:hypothetical protein
MSTIVLLKSEFEQMRRHVNGIIQGLTKDALLWTHPGISNSIGTILLHIFHGEDRLIRCELQGISSLWETDHWSRQIGIADLPIRGQEWTDIDIRGLQFESLLAYNQAVEMATMAYLNKLSDTDLETRVEIYGNWQSRAETLFSVIIHNTSHAGEIATLKGLQGMRGRLT